MRWVIALIIALVVLGCSTCKKCHGQEAAKTQVITVSEVLTWKKNIYLGLTEVGEDPYQFIANVYLMEVLGLNMIPASPTAEIKVKSSGLHRLAQTDTMAGITRAAKTLNAIDKMARTNQRAFAALVRNLTATVEDERQREKILKTIEVLR